MENQFKKVVKIVEKITNENKAPCKKTLQKIIYLLEQKGLDMGFDYDIHFYGPYSAELDYAVQQLNVNGYLNVEYTQSGHIISEAKKIENVFSKQEDEIVNKVISCFGKDSPSELELLATTLFVANNITQINKEKILKGVIKIKGDKYSSEHINAAITKLCDNYYFTLCK